MNKKIVIGLIIAIVVAGAAAAYVAFDMMSYEKKTVEIFENGTTMVVPSTLELTNKTEDTINFNDEENTTYILGIKYDDKDNFLNVNGIIESIADEYIHNVTDKAELQDNGVFKLSSEARKKLAAQSGTNTKNKDDAKDLYIGVLKNDTLNQTIIIVSENEQYVVDMMDSVEWKKPSESGINETDTVTNTKKSTKNIEEEDSETEDTSTETGVSEDNNEEDFTDYETDDSYEEDYSEDEITYGEEEFNG